MPLEQLRQVPKVVLAFDQDQTGEEITQRLMQDMPDARRHAPSEKDWNEDLQAHLKQLQQQFQIQQHTQEDRTQTKQRDQGPTI